MIIQRIVLAVVLAAVAPSGFAQEAQVSRLSQQLAALDADPRLGSLAAYERLQARQALQRLAEARSGDRDAAQYVAERRVQQAETAARTEAMRRDIERLDRERSELLVEASRRDAARARAEAERLRSQAQIQAEEAARLREQAAADAVAMQDADTALQSVAGAQAAKLEAARQREAELARQEAELLSGGPLPGSTRDARGEVFVLAGDAFASGQARLTAGASASVRALAAYLSAAPATPIRVVGHTDDQGTSQANLALSQRRAGVVRDALVAGGVPASRIEAVGRGGAQPVADNESAAGRALNRRVEVIVAP